MGRRRLLAVAVPRLLARDREQWEGEARRASSSSGGKSRGVMVYHPVAGRGEARPPAALTS